MEDDFDDYEFDQLLDEDSLNDIDHIIDSQSSGVISDSENNPESNASSSNIDSFGKIVILMEDTYILPLIRHTCFQSCHLICRQMYTTNSYAA